MQWRNKQLLFGQVGTRVEIAARIQETTTTIKLQTLNVFILNHTQLASAKS